MKDTFNNVYELIVLLQSSVSFYLLFNADDELVQVLSVLSLIVLVKSLVENYIVKGK